MDLTNPIAYLHIRDGLLTVAGAEVKRELFSIFKINMEPIQIGASIAEAKSVFKFISGVPEAIHHVNDSLDVLFFCYFHRIGISALGKGEPFHILCGEVHDVNVSDAPAIDPGEENQYDSQKSAADQPFGILYKSVHIPSSLCWSGGYMSSLHLCHFQQESPQFPALLLPMNEVKR